MQTSWNRFPFACALAVCASVLAAGQTAPSYIITTVAGTGAGGFAGDGSLGTSAQLNQPSSIFLRSNGDLYITDLLNYRVRLLTTAGSISTIAGSGTPGYQGDSGSATAARIGGAYGVAVDSSGNVYIADSTNNVIRRVSGGNMATYAGTGGRAYAGDGGAATDAFLALPTGMAFGPDGALYFADTLNNRIRRIGSDGKIATVAGTGSENYNGDDIPATSAALARPSAIAFDGAGNLYIADTFNQRIRKVDAGGTITTVAGSGFQGGFAGDGGPAAAAVLNYPRGVAVDGSGRVYIADTFNNRIRIVLENGVIRTIAGDGRFFDSGDDGPALAAQMRFPRALAVDPQGRVYVTDTDSHRIRLLTPVPQAPAISRGGAVTSSAFGGFGAVAAGSWLEIYGSDLAARTRQWSGNDFVDDRAPVTLGGTSVTIGGREAFVAYVSPGQVNVQVPADLIPGERDLVVHTSEGTSVPYPLNVETAEPGLLAPPAFLIGGKQYAAGLLAGGSTYALPAGAVEGVGSRPARPGEIVTFYGVGFGPVAPLLSAGEIARRPSSLILPLEIYFGDTQATVAYAGLAPGFLGLYQLNVVVPIVASPGDVLLRFSLDGEENTQELFVSVAN